MDGRGRGCVGASPGPADDEEVEDGAGQEGGVEDIGAVALPQGYLDPVGGGEGGQEEIEQDYGKQQGIEEGQAHAVESAGAVADVGDGDDAEDGRAEDGG